MPPSGGDPSSTIQPNLTETTLNVSQGSQSAIQLPQSKQLFVLFTVKGARRTPEVAQINAQDYSDDGRFFVKPRSEYKSLRGYLRYWFSIWTLSHCDFIKVLLLTSKFKPSLLANYFSLKKIRAGRIIPRIREIPTDVNYEYTPRPPMNFS